ncbi:MAG: FHA domain-containing protein [Myxococcales bacterium]|nr:FHA domain-containing protein [Myxococcales bacterium]
MPKLVYHDSSGARGTVDIGTEVVLIGRATECQIQTQDGLVSRRHARVVYDGSYWVEDLGSANGVYVGSERVQKYKLKPGDTFRCGHVEVRFEVEDMHRTAIGVSPGMVVPMSPLAAPPGLKAVPPPNAPPALSFAEAAAQQRAFTTKPTPASAAPPVPAAPPAAGPPPPAAPPAAPGSDPPSGRSGSKTGGMAPPPAAAVLLSEAQNPGRAADVAAAEVSRLRAELEVERQRRAEVERECDQAQQRASDLMRKADEAQRGADEARRRLDELQVKLDESAARANIAVSEGDSERLRRRVEQLESELRRKGGGGGGAGAGEALRAAEAERDRLRTRVGELEAQLAQAVAAQAAPTQQAASSTASADQDMELTRLKRRVEQLESELRRARGGKAGSDDGSSGKLAELETELRRLREEKDAALQAQGGSSKLAEELAAARRRIDQLESDARRRPMGAVSDDKRIEVQRAELEAALRQLRDCERERDSLREMVARASGAPARPAKEVSDSLQQVSDGLADVRAALRASGDDMALEQLEQLRTALRKACGLLGINV